MKSRAQRYRYVRHVVSGTRPSPWSPLSLGSSLAAWYKADAGCYTDAACKFTSASSQKLSVASTAALNPTSAMSLFVMAKINSISATSCIASKGATGDYSWGLQFESDRIACYISTAAASATGSYASAAHGLSAGDQTSVCVVFNGSGATNADRLKIYIGGSLLTLSFTGTTPVSLLASASAFEFGYWDAGGNYSKDIIGRGAFYGRALSGAEIAALHNSNTGIFYADMTAAQKVGLIESWNLCEASGSRVGSHAGLNLTPTNGPTVAAGPGEGACVDNSPRKRIADQSGNARHRTQATIGKQPLYLDAIQNGRAVGRFDGTDDFDQVIANIGAQPLTIYTAMKRNAAGNNIQIDGGDVGNRVILSRLLAVNNTELYAGSRIASADDGGAFHVYELLCNGASSAILIDGVSVASGNAGALGLAGGFTMGSAYDGTGSSVLDECETFIVVGAMTAAQKTSARAYLAARWGI